MTVFNSKLETYVYKYLHSRGYTGFLVNQYPSWLVNPITRRCMQLDLYDPEIGVAVEIQGPAHSSNYSQIMRDSIKSEVCNLNRVTLYYVRFWDKSKDLKKICEYLETLQKYKLRDSSSRSNKKTSKRTKKK